MPLEKLVLEPVLLNTLTRSCHWKGVDWKIPVIIYILIPVHSNKEYTSPQAFLFIDKNHWWKLQILAKMLLDMLRPRFAQYKRKFNAPLGSVFYGEEEFRWSNNQFMEYTCLEIVKTNFIFTRRGSHSHLEFLRRDCCKLIIRYYTVVFKLKDKAYFGR